MVTIGLNDVFLSGQRPPKYEGSCPDREAIDGNEINNEDPASAEIKLQPMWNCLAEIYIAINGYKHDVLFDGLGTEYNLDSMPVVMTEDIHETLRYFYYLLCQCRYYRCNEPVVAGEPILKMFNNLWPLYAQIGSIGTVHLQKDYNFLNNLKNSVSDPIEEYQVGSSLFFYYNASEGIHIGMHTNNPLSEFQGNIYYRLKQDVYSTVSSGLPAGTNYPFYSGSSNRYFTTYNPVGGADPGYYDCSYAVRFLPLVNGITYCAATGHNGFKVRRIHTIIAVQDSVPDSLI